MKQILINDEGLQARVAVVENGKLQEFFIERKDSDRMVGSIYKGVIRNLEPSLQAAFVDIGAQKNAFLHYWDMLPATKDTIEDDEDELDNFEVPEEPQAAPAAALSFFGRIAAFFRGLFGSADAEPVAAGKAMERRDYSERDNEPGGDRGGNRDRGGDRGGRGRGRGGRSGGGGGRPQGGGQPGRRPGGGGGRPSAEDIPKLFRVGDEILVQVTKGPIGTKGARVTANLSIPGRELVLLPNAPHLGISKRIEDKDERTRLRNILKGLKLPHDMGVICRTVGAGKGERDFRQDMTLLLQTWHHARELYKRKPAPWCVYQEPEIVERTLRDYLTEDVEEIVADSKETFDLSQEIVQRHHNSTVKIRQHNQPKPIFQFHNLTNEIDAVFFRKVMLPSGGHLCIDEAEALIAIDVNSGKNRSGKDHPETIINTNMEAVAEIARQLRLRNVGGIVVLDLIDMVSKQDQQLVYRTFKNALLADRARTKVYPISPLGLIEMTRQREHESLQDTVYCACPYCDGKGRILSEVSMSVDLQRCLRELLARNGKIPLRVTVHPQLLNRLKNEDAALLQLLEQEFGGELSFRADPALHLEEYRVFNAKTNAIVAGAQPRSSEPPPQQQGGRR
jgi:ribonuclease G